MANVDHARAPSRGAIAQQRLYKRIFCSARIVWQNRSYQDLPNFGDTEALNTSFYAKVGSVRAPVMLSQVDPIRVHWRKLCKGVGS